MRKFTAILALLLLAASPALAQLTRGGAYSAKTPYSVYGVGDMYSPGTAYNVSMGGVGIANRSHKFINPVNPASITARDSLSVMADMSLLIDNKIFYQSDMKSASNIFNIRDIIITLPVYRSSAFILGIMPYSATGYEAYFNETDPLVIASTSNITNNYHGQGSIYQLFAGGAVTFWKKLSIGAEYIYYFGNIQKMYRRAFDDDDYLNVNNDYEIQLSGHSGKFGLQFEQFLGKKYKLGLGATYNLKADVGGKLKKMEYSLGTVGVDDNIIKTTRLDTIPNRMSLASEIGVGISINYYDKVKAEFNYTWSDWRGCNFEKNMGFAVYGSTGVIFTPSVSQAFRLGFEYTPNRNDIRYLSRFMSSKRVFQLISQA